MKSRRNGEISRRTFVRGSLAATAGVCGLALVGCGDDGAPTPTTTAVLPTRTIATVPTNAPTVRSWRQIEFIGETPGARRDHSLTIAGPQGAYLFGGRLKGESLNDLWLFDATAKIWSRIDAENPPPERFAHNTTWDGARGRLVVSMGQGGSGALYNDVWAFDPGTKGWTEISGGSTERPEVRYGTGGAHDVSGGRLLMSHGFTDVGRFDDTWAFDLAAGTWSRTATSGTVPIKRCLLRTLWLPEQHRMLLFGGQTDNTPFLGDFWSLDPATGAWEEKKPSSLPGPRNLYGASLDVASQRWYVVSGNTPDGPSSETWAYDIRNDVWAAAEDPASSAMIPPRYSADAVVIDGSLYVYGGHDGTAEISDMWVLPLVT